MKVRENEIGIVAELVQNLKRLDALHCLRCGSPLPPVLDFTLLKCEPGNIELGAYIRCPWCGEKNILSDLIASSKLVVMVPEEGGV